MHAEQADLRSKVTSKSPNPTLPGSTLLSLQAVICLIPRDTLLLSWPSRDPFAQIECWQPFFANICRKGLMTGHKMSTPETCGCVHAVVISEFRLELIK